MELYKTVPRLREHLIQLKCLKSTGFALLKVCVHNMTTAAGTSFAIFFVVTQFGLVGGFQNFRGTYCLNRNPEFMYVCMYVCVCVCV
jgi:hypothetical protein